jgi:transposase
VAKRYRVTLTDEERQDLEVLARKRTAPARMVRRAQALLLAAEDKTDEAIAGQLRMGVATLERLRRRFVEEGLEASLHERPRPGARPKLGPREQAFVVALACTKPPEGRHRWTMQLLADRVAELELVPDISDEAIRRSSKEPAQAVALQGVDHPDGRGRLRLPDGGRARPVRRGG